MLRSEIDLLWFGGIGTFIKATEETHAEVGDKANDATRIDGREVRAKIVGEGANLGVTQRGRIEFAQSGAADHGGGRINTDAIDNSAGVDTSDHEVNIKVLTGDVLARGDMTLKQRDQLLASMTDEVGELVLSDNYLQPQAISVAGAAGVGGLEEQARFMRVLEKAGHLNRAIEFLPDEEEIAARAASRAGADPAGTGGAAGLFEDHAVRPVAGARTCRTIRAWSTIWSSTSPRRCAAITARRSSGTGCAARSSRHMRPTAWSTGSALPS